VLTLCITFLAAVYLLGPDLLSRWILGFLVPRRNISQNRGEEVTRAVVWAAFPLGIVIVWVRTRHILPMWGSWQDVQTVLSSLYSTNYFDAHRSEFYPSLRAVLGMNLSLLWRLAVVVATFSVGLNIAILNYSAMRRRLPFSWMKALLATIVLPRISEWHILLSDMLLPSKNVVLTAEVLIRSGVLYRGPVQDKMISSDGGLQTITLSNPYRFLRDEFKKEKAKEDQTRSEDFWRTIPGNLFVILGSDIVNVNIRYTRKPSEKDQRVIRHILAQMAKPPEAEKGVTRSNRRTTP
jgi:hypothetical protein